MSLFNYTVSKTIMHVPSPVIRYFARDYVAGDTIADAVRVCRELEAKGIESTLDILGEYITQKDQAIPWKKECLHIIEAISELGLKSNLSIKPSQMGIKLDYDFALQNLREVIARAAELNGFVRIDMEDVDCNEPTIKMYQTLREEFPNSVGTALQSYMRNAINHLELLKDGPLNLRLVKGIFIVNRQQAWKDPKLVTRNYVHLLERMFEIGAYVGIATHDEALYLEAQHLIRKFGLKRDQYEFQMLLGIDPELRDLIVSEGHRLRVYIPYGKEWLGYSRRRLLENPNIARESLKQILRLRGRAGH